MKKLCSFFGLGAVAMLSASSVFAADVVDNPVSAFPIIVDGQFTGGVANGQIQGEWSDITPLAFNSPSSDAGNLTSVPLGSPSANSLLYGAVAQGASESADELYLMYDYAPRTSQSFASGQTIATISFPLTVGGQVFNNSSVVITSPQILLASLGSGSVIPIDVNVNLGNGTTEAASLLGIDAAVGFNSSTLSSNPHLLVELEVPLLIPAGFASSNSPLPSAGSSGVYSPNPAFWSADIGNDSNDPPASSALFTIEPDGTTQILPGVPVAAPDNAYTIALLIPALCGLELLRRKMKMPAPACVKVRKVK